MDIRYHPDGIIYIGKYYASPIEYNDDAIKAGAPNLPDLPDGIIGVYVPDDESKTPAHATTSDRAQIACPAAWADFARIVADYAAALADARAAAEARPTVT